MAQRHNGAMVILMLQASDFRLLASGFWLLASGGTPPLKSLSRFGGRSKRSEDSASAEAVGM
jgi:hypothetical protein